MTLSQRIGKITGALITALGAWIMLKMGEKGFLFVSLLLSFSLIVFGARMLIYYFAMARHMVDGRSLFYVGVIGLDLGIFTLSVTRFQGHFIALYLLGAHAFSGVMDILRALEARRFRSPSWRMKLAEGVVNIGFAAAAVVFGLLLGDTQDLTLIYAAGLLYTACVNLISAFRKTAIVYIP